MQWFGAVKPNMPYTTTGLNTYPSAGPYYIASRDPGRTTVLKRNPYYKGTRPANPDQIVFTSNTDPDQSLLQVKANQSDLDMNGVARHGGGRPRLDLRRQQGPLLGRADLLRRLPAAEHGTGADEQRRTCGRRSTGAIDRPAVLRILGKYAGARSDQILVPGIPGYKPVQDLLLGRRERRAGEEGRRQRDRLGSDPERAPHDVGDPDRAGPGRRVQPGADGSEGAGRPDCRARRTTTRSRRRARPTTSPAPVGAPTTSTRSTTSTSFWTVGRFRRTTTPTCRT